MIALRFTFRVLLAIVSGAIIYLIASRVSIAIALGMLGFLYVLMKD